LHLLDVGYDAGITISNVAVNLVILVNRVETGSTSLEVSDATPHVHTVTIYGWTALLDEVYGGASNHEIGRFRSPFVFRRVKRGMPV
jgi:hypothetical protein